MPPYFVVCSLKYLPKQHEVTGPGTNRSNIAQEAQRPPALPPMRKKQKERIENQQYEIEYRIRTGIGNAFYEVHARTDWDCFLGEIYTFEAQK